MLLSTRRTPVILLVGLGACTSVQPAPLEALSVLRHAPLQRVVESLRPELSASVEQAGFNGQQASGPKIELTLQLFGVDSVCVQQAVGGAAAMLSAVIVPRAQAEGLTSRLAQRSADGVQVLTDSRMELFVGTSGDMTVLNQRAYIGGFEIRTTHDSAIADPRIDLAQEGILFHVAIAPEALAGAVAFDFELTQTCLDAKFGERRVDLVSSAAPITLQVPSGLSDRLSASCSMGRDEALVFAGKQLVPGGGARAILGVVTAQRSGP